MSIDGESGILSARGLGFIDPIHWVISSKIILGNGDVYGFVERPYLVDMFTSRSRLKCIRKGRGMGFSETEILSSIHGLYSGRYRQGVQYVFPTDTDMRKFAQSRFNIVIGKNRCLRDMVMDTNTTNYKRVGEGNLFLDGGGVNRVIEGLQYESMTFRGTQVDKAVLDELDMFEDANSVVDSALTSMKNSSVKEVVALSNPSIPGFGIDGLFQRSSQNFWYRQCRCGGLTCIDKEFPDLIDRRGCHCRLCGELLGWRGLWRADEPGRSNLVGLRSMDWEGYHISDLNAPNDDPYMILEKFKDKSESNLEKLYKFSLGLPFMPRTSALTLNEVYNCCGYQPEYDVYDEPSIMGVDVGYSSGFHVVIGIKTGKDEYQVLRVSRLQGFEDVALLGHRFKVKTCVCDYLPETTAARRFQREAGFKVWLNIYNTTNPVDEVVWNYEDRTVKIYRNYIFDISQRVVVDRRVKFPRRSSNIEEFAKQYIVPVKIQDKMRQGNVFKYFSTNPSDHYRNAMNYFLTAGFVSRTTKPLGSPRAPAYVLNDTPRYI